MRIKFTEDSENIAIVDSFWFGLYDDDIIDKLDYERWSDELFRTGMLDLTNTSYRFTFGIDDDDEEDSEDTE
jgi:hypothetical protein